MSAAADSAPAEGRRSEERRAMGVAGGAHALHDGYTDLIYVMLPIWQAEFGLSYAAIGLLRGVFAGTMAGFQIPSGLLSERLGTPLVLAAGTALAGFGYCLALFVDSYTALIAILLIAGLGASTQHPLASALVARAFAGTRSLGASVPTISPAISERWRCLRRPRCSSSCCRGARRWRCSARSDS